ncbi:IS5 family transposase [Variovorax boronicumulans]|nr:IS5 family transposase [Variovorax boronicumulans]MDQ0005782.1 IS5 family transposase [Variovorax boronicumulans]MDQ0044416.1 IS5 family transposase [Variovorax boronicumulans]
MLKVIEPHYPVAGRGLRPYSLEAMLRVHLMQNWFAFSDPAMEEAFSEIASLRAFVGLGLESTPDETTILNFRHLLDGQRLGRRHLQAGQRPSGQEGTASEERLHRGCHDHRSERDPEMHQTKKGNSGTSG